MTFDAEKFRELVLYIADKSVEDPTFGAVKLNKILFFADFLAYANLGAPITGAEYQKREFGPAPRQMLAQKRILMEQGDATEVPKLHYGKQQKRLTALRKPDLSMFKPEEIALVDDVLDTLIHHNARETSELSHRWAVGWSVAEDGETIPYETAFWAPPEAVTKEDLERGQELADELGWVVR